MFCVSCVSHAFASVHCCLVVTCWERSDLLGLVGDANSIFVTFLCGILGQMWYLVVSFPDLSRLSYFLARKPIWWRQHPPKTIGVDGSKRLVKTCTMTSLRPVITNGHERIQRWG